MNASGDQISSFKGSGSIEDGHGTIFMIEEDGESTDELAAHIARHDPARVLRETEAKRAILANLQSHQRALELRHSDVNCGAYLMLLDACQRFAAVYSDHPDYDPAWA